GCVTLHARALAWFTVGSGVGIVVGHAHGVVGVGDVVNQYASLIGGEIKEIAHDHGLVRRTGLLHWNDDVRGQLGVGRIADVVNVHANTLSLVGHDYKATVLR